MNNDILWLIMLVVNFAMIMFAFRRWGKTGLFIWMPISCIIANIQVVKNAEIFGLESTLGNIVYATSFLATDILSEFYGKEDANKAVKYGMFSLVCMTVLMQFAIMFTPSVSDVYSPSMSKLFSLMPRITVASFAAYYLSNRHDIWAFMYWKEKTDGKYLWFRNNASTMVSQMIDTLVFTLGAFLFVFPIRSLVQIMFTTYLLKIVTALFDTTMIYLARRWIKKGKIKDYNNLDSTTSVVSEN